ncbi:hypothetical protein RvY_03759 [Ramazzottius varieornatus]|uniref:Uncharacterized protein n=1 Tax=Ramazzottius varieornatus TaxID=947166 RepID=A0A1D1UYK7_RAMVA|nr:hypothetical protein RvY_03759 [Ramazzottius varieornatus]
MSCWDPRVPGCKCDEESPPLVIGPDAQGQYSGYIIDVLNGLKNDGANDFDWELSARPDNVCGDHFANGTINVLMYDVYSGMSTSPSWHIVKDDLIPTLYQYDIAVSELAVTRNRSEVVDFAQQVFATGARVAVNRNYNNETAQYFVIPAEGLIDYFNKTKFPPAAPISKSIQANLPASILDNESKISAVVRRLVNGDNIALVGNRAPLAEAIDAHTDTIFIEPGFFRGQFYAFAVKLGT